MGRKVVGPMGCVTHVKKKPVHLSKREGFAPVFLAVAAIQYALNKVLNNWVSDLITAITFLKVITP